MKRFDFLQPRSLDEALAAWTPGAAWLGGGTNLVDLMKIGVAEPERVIDIARLPGLDRIEALPDGSVRIGALVRNSDLADDADFARRFPMVAEAILSGASGQLRNAATLAGNLMQAPRCPWFQNPTAACNLRDPGSGCAALGQGNGAMAVLGWTEACIATNPSDLCVPLAALGAVVEVQGPEGAREIAFAELHRLPGPETPPGTALRPGELILALRLPPGAAEFAAHARYLKVRDRTSFAFATVSAAAALQPAGGRIAAARLALGAVAAKPWRVPEAEALLIGQAPDPALFDRAAAVALAGALPSAGNGWKIALARRAAARALAMAAAGTPARMPALPASPFGDPAGDAIHG